VAKLFTELLLVCFDESLWGSFDSVVEQTQLLAPNNWGGHWRCICSPDIRNVSALEVLRNRSVQIDIYLLPYLQTCQSIIAENHIL